MDVVKRYSVVEMVSWLWYHGWVELPLVVLLFIKNGGAAARTFF